MTTTQDDRPVTDHPAKNSSQRGYEVGYCKPPVAHRFKQGNQANPRGRKKGSRNHKVVVREVLFEAVTVREGDNTRKMSALEAVIKKMLAKALAGDSKAALTIIGLAQKEGLLTAEQDQEVENLLANDLAILEDAKRRFVTSASEPAEEDDA